MKKRIAVIVPVSVFEPAETLVNSARHLRSLDFGDFEFTILYAFDGDESDERVKLLRREGVDVLARNTRRGKRAGAINDAIRHLKKFKPDLVAIFDADSRPERDFLLRCADRVERDVYISSTVRKVSNPYTLIARAVELEYRLIGFLLKVSGFRQFNGLIGVLNFRHLERYGLSEDALTEDADFATRMHALGFRAELAEGCVYEQSPVTISDFYSQRKRWYYGGLELWRYLDRVLSSGNPHFVTSWLSALTLTYFPVLYLPFVLLSLPALLALYGKDGVLVYAGMIVYAVTLQIASFSAMLNFLRREGVEWKAMTRVE
ncbi:MAG: glycosyltransferase family 2 protein [Archaeoglobi archaeon]|nr:glycosyltransferase family 2 protein [Archaeoglobi archaeon]